MTTGFLARCRKGYIVFLFPIPLAVRIIGFQIGCIGRSIGYGHIRAATCPYCCRYIPLARVFKGDACQTATIVERIISNARHAVGDRDVCQIATMGERIISNARYAVPDRDACKTATIVERIISNARHAVRDRDACQTATIGERMISNARHAVRDCDACQSRTIVERIIANNFCLSRNGTSCN